MPALAAVGLWFFAATVSWVWPEMKRAVLFDFDFTLADSSAGIVDCVQYALRRLRLEPPDIQAVRRTIGLSLPALFVTLTGLKEPDVVEDFCALFVERADAVMVPLTSVYAESASVLRQLRARGIGTAIVSTKFRFRIEAILAAANLAGTVDVIVGGEDVSEHKPHPSGLLRALSELAVDPPAGLYVGDHPVDGLAAQSAGIRFVRVLTGVEHGSAAWTGIDPFAVIENVGGLFNLPDVIPSMAWESR